MHFMNIISEQEKGVEFMINGELKVMFRTVAVISADNLGSLFLGGFKESCSAYWMCWHCLCTKEEFSDQVWYTIFENALYCLFSLMKEVLSFETKLHITANVN